MNHPEMISLIIAYTIVGAFVFTVIITCLSLIGIIELKDESQQSKLFNILIVEVVVGCIAFFFNWIELNPIKVENMIKTDAIIQGAEVFKAVSDNNTQVVQKLLDQGFNVNDEIDKHRGRPLHLSAERCHIEMTKLLISRGASTNIENEFGDSPLEIAEIRCQSNPEIIKLFKQQMR